MRNILSTIKFPVRDILQILLEQTCLKVSLNFYEKNDIALHLQ